MAAARRRESRGRLIDIWGILNERNRFVDSRSAAEVVAQEVVQVRVLLSFVHRLADPQLEGVDLLLYLHGFSVDFLLGLLFALIDLPQLGHLLAQGLVLPRNLVYV